MAINGGIFGSFLAGGGTFNNQLTQSPGLLAGQTVNSNPFFNPTPIFQNLFQPFPYAANSLVTPNLVSLTGGGTPLIGSYLTISPFTNPLLNLFNPATTPGLGGLPGAQNNNAAAGAGAGGAGGALSGLAGLSTLLKSLGL